MKQLFYLPYKDLAQSVAVAGPSVLEKLVRETNGTKPWSMWEDQHHKRVVVECEIKPQDAPVYNLFWKPLSRCARCGAEFEPPEGDEKPNVCGNCADELRDEEKAAIAQAEAEDEAEARARWEAEEAEGERPED